MNRQILLSSLVLGSVLLVPPAVESCKPGDTPTVVLEAGVTPVVDQTCAWLEGVTDNTTVLSICATAEEVLVLVGIIAPLLSKSTATSSTPTDAGACKMIPSTTLCATREQLGVGILALIERRRARLLLDAGAPDAGLAARLR